MGCFLACSGLSSKKRKRRKPSNNNPSRDQKLGFYQPLDSDLHPNIDEASENPNRIKSNSSSSRSSIKIIKKVTFNLNVKTYEPLPNVDFTSYFSDQEKEEDTMEWSSESELSAYPANYRYHNCIEDEEEDGVLEIDEDSDTEDGVNSSDDDEEYDGDYEENDMKITEELGSATMDKRSSSLDQELKKLGVNSKATRDRSQYVFSVLNPVENLTQWKAVKAKTRQLTKHQSKENVPPCPKQTKPLLHDDAVNASLSNWLVLSKAGPNTTV